LACLTPLQDINENYKSLHSMHNASTKIEFASVTVSFFIHSTEDQSRLIEEISQGLSVSRDLLSLEALEAHYGNTVYYAKAHLTGQEATRLAEFILKELTPASKQEIISQFEKSLDEHDALYLRLDRQLITRRLTLSQDEPIRIKLKPKNRNRIRETYMEFLNS
jgi:RNA binding exosome subunit